MSNAYAVGIGDWDKVAVRYTYGDFAPGTNATAARLAILADAAKRDLHVLSDQDPGYNPHVDRWANGTNPATELRRIMTVRRAALNRLGEATIRRDQPWALLEDALVPVFLHHRYQIEAAASALGGQYYLYLLRGDGEPARRPVPATEQRAALDALIATLKSSELVVPRQVLDILAPRPTGFDLHRELFPRYTGLPFDPITPGLTAADLTITAILDPTRAARLVSQSAYDSTLPGLSEVTGRLIAAVFDEKPTNGYEAEVNRAIERVLVERLITLAGEAPMPQVRAIAAAALRRIAVRLRALDGLSEGQVAHKQLLATDINRFITRPLSPRGPVALPQSPPGAPIGGAGGSLLSADEDWCGMRTLGREQAFFPPLFVERPRAVTDGTATH